MNKKLMALAVAGALAAPGLAVAQAPTQAQMATPAGVASNAGITLYGRLDETIVSSKYSATPNFNGSGAGTGVSEVKKGDVWSPGNAMGIRGREDLGGGTALWFQLEIGVWPSERLDTATTTGNNWGGRNSGLGFSSGIGDILVGIWDTPYKVTYGVWNSVTSGGFSSAGIIMGNGDQTGALNNALCQTTISNTTGSLALTAPAVNSCVTEATANGTAFSRRISDSIQYWSPVYAGFQVKLMTALATYQSPGVSPQSGTIASGLPKAKEYSANVSWVRGPFTVAAAYDSHEGLRPGTAVNSVANPKDHAIQLGGKFNFGPGEVGIGYEQLTYANNAAPTALNNGMKVSNYVVNGRWNIGPGAVWASYGWTPGGKDCQGTAAFNSSTGAGNLVIGNAACASGSNSSSDAGKANMVTVGYDYVLSKRTKMYVAYNKIDNGLSTNYYYVAGPAGNNANGTASGVQAGTDVTTFALGIQHLF